MLQFCNIISPSAKFEYKNVKFILSETPEESSIEPYIKILKKQENKNNENHIYLIDTHPISNIFKYYCCKHNIKQISSIHFPENEIPNDHTIKEWMNILHNIMVMENEDEHITIIITIMCRSGLSSGPFLAVIALMTLFDLKYYRAINIVRSAVFRSIKQRALNKKQISFLIKFQPSSYVKKEIYNENENSKCMIQ